MGFNRLLKNWIGRPCGTFSRKIRSRLATMHTHHVFALAFLARKIARRSSATSFSATC
jgi:hypothetical protein